MFLFITERAIKDILNAPAWHRDGSSLVELDEYLQRETHSAQRFADVEAPLAAARHYNVDGSMNVTLPICLMR
jgi:hypothetical protein